MTTKRKGSVSLSLSLLEELAPLNKGGNISQFVEQILVHYIAEVKRQEQRYRDIEIIDANAERFRKEAEENLEFQAML
ncbi:hypothetical protein FACS1894200_05910 [Spirochaetia bacterium]|nr:hypothetical protein FACS1894200_05910 [Spirochaetia bacterium]